MSCIEVYIIHSFSSLCGTGRVIYRETTTAAEGKAHAPDKVEAPFCSRIKLYVDVPAFS
jgi:hypothetical protein